MAPAWLSSLAVSPEAASSTMFRRDVNTSDPSTVQDYLTVQWLNPGDILSVLLLLGPDIVQRAVAQLAGRAVTPVAFSFGWVAYAASALLAAFGDGKLMPDADIDNTTVVDAETGHHRTTKSWVLGRLLRDEDERLDETMEDEAAHVPPTTVEDIHNPTVQPEEQHGSRPPKQPWEALRVTIYDVDPNPPCPHGVPTLDLAWYSGFIVILLQLVIGILAWVLEDNWGTFLVTASGTVLALIGGSLPQWTHEKWSCPRKGGATVILTQGNGSRHATVILGRRKEKYGLDLEILARGMRTVHASWTTRVASAVLAFLWIILLITVSGLKENTWYLLGIGLLGSIQNLFAAGTARKPSALGIHLKYREVIRADRVAKVLKEAEEKHPGLGISLLDIFFPGTLRIKNEDLGFWREALDSRFAPNKYGTRVDRIPPVEPSASGKKKEESKPKNEESELKNEKSALKNGKSEFKNEKGELENEESELKSGESELKGEESDLKGSVHIQAKDGQD